MKTKFNVIKKINKTKKGFENSDNTRNNNN